MKITESVSVAAPWRESAAVAVSTSTLSQPQVCTQLWAKVCCIFEANKINTFLFLLSNLFVFLCSEFGFWGSVSEMAPEIIPSTYGEAPDLWGTLYMWTADHKLSPRFSVTLKRRVLKHTESGSHCGHLTCVVFWMCRHVSEELTASILRSKRSQACNERDYYFLAYSSTVEMETAFVPKRRCSCVCY
jgi:hypothetical protein